MLNLDEAIRVRAYHLWIADGGRHGSAEHHWLSAQREVLAASMADPALRHAPAQTIEHVATGTESYPAKKAKATTARKAKRRAA